MKFQLKLLFIVFLLIPLVAWAKFPEPNGYVNDFANALSIPTKDKLESTLSSFAKQTGIEIAIATLISSNGEEIDQLAVDLYKEWGIGKKGVDKGLLILLIPSERWARIEVGYGLEGAINDAYAGKIRRDVMFPYLKAGDIDGGLVAGVGAILNRIIEVEKIDFKADLPNEPQGYSEIGTEKSGPIHKVLKVLFIIFLIYMFIKHPRLLIFFLLFSGGGGRSGGSFGGSGFGGFGGGLSGGGGSSGRW